MKKISSTIMAWVILAGAGPLTGRAQQGTYTVHGDAALLAAHPVQVTVFPGQPTPGKAYLHRYTLEDGQHTDSVTATDGKFTFNGTIKAPETGQIIFGDGSTQQSIVFYLQPGIITIRCPKDGNHAIVQGTPLNDDLQVYKDMLNHYLDSLNTNRPVQGRFNQFSKEIQTGKLDIIRAFLIQHPASPVSLDQLTQYAIMNGQPDLVAPLFETLTSSLRNTVAGIQLADRVKGMKTAVGNPAPVFTLPDTKGKNVSLSDFRGKYVLVDFWATWCGPCMAEMPNVAKAFHEYKDKGFAVVGVSLDRPDSKAAWLNVIQRDHLDWIQVSDLQFWNSKAALAYNVNAVPANFLIDPQGKIIAKNLRGDKLEAKLAEVLPGATTKTTAAATTTTTTAATTTTTATSGGAQFAIDGSFDPGGPVTGKIYLAYEDNDAGMRDSSALVDGHYHFTGALHDGAIDAHISYENRALTERAGRWMGAVGVWISRGTTTINHGAGFSRYTVGNSPVQRDEDAFKAIQRKHEQPEKDMVAAFIRNHPDSWYSFVLLEQEAIRTYDYSTGETDSLFDVLNPALSAYARVKMFKQMMDGRKAAVIGNSALDFSQRDLNGKVISLADYKGKYLLLDFWASWCHPCRAENPNVTAAYHKYRDKGLNILSVSLDGDRASWIAAVGHDKLEWPQVSNLKAFNDEIAVKYGIHSIPRNFLIGPDGKIVAMDLRGDDLDKELGRIFK